MEFTDEVDFGHAEGIIYEKGLTFKFLYTSLLYLLYKIVEWQEVEYDTTLLYKKISLILNLVQKKVQLAMHVCATCELTWGILYIIAAENSKTRILYFTDTCLTCSSVQ